MTKLKTFWRGGTDLPGQPDPASGQGAESLRAPSIGKSASSEAGRLRFGRGSCRGSLQHSRPFQTRPKVGAATDELIVLDDMPGVIPVTRRELDRNFPRQSNRPAAFGRHLIIIQTTLNRPAIRPPPLSLGAGRSAGGRMNCPRSKAVAWAASTGRLKK